MVQPSCLLALRGSHAWSFLLPTRGLSCLFALAEVPQVPADPGPALHAGSAGPVRNPAAGEACRCWCSGSWIHLESGGDAPNAQGEEGAWATSILLCVGGQAAPPPHSLCLAADSSLPYTGLGVSEPRASGANSPKVKLCSPAGVGVLGEGVFTGVFVEEKPGMEGGGT